jgi:hypothetical protein
MARDLGSDMSIDQARWQRHREATASMAGRRGWQIPDEYRSLTAVAKAARDVAAEQPAQDGDPAKPEAVAKWIDTQVAQRVQRDQRTAVATELAERADMGATRTVLAEIPGNYIPALCAEFNSAVTRFHEVAAAAPSEVTAHTSPADAERHVTLLSVVEQLTIAASDRSTLASVTGELVSLDHDNCWLWLDPDEDTATVHQIIDLLATFRTSQPVDLNGWDRAVQIGVKLAGYNQAEDRRDRFNQARYAAGMSPSGGLQDMSLREAHRLVGARPPRQLAASS